MSQSCREAGTWDYGIYPLSNRFYMDQVPLDLSQFGKASLNPKGAGFCLITGADKKSAKRFGTIQVFFVKNFRGKISFQNIPPQWSRAAKPEKRASKL